MVNTQQKNIILNDGPFSDLWTLRAMEVSFPAIKILM